MSPPRVPPAPTGIGADSGSESRPDVVSTGMKGYSTISGPAAAAGIPVIGINYDAVQDYLKWFMYSVT